MSDELFYTSAPRGLRPGTNGFCTVAATANLGRAWQERLEGLSGYRPVFGLGDPRAGENPVVFSHVRLSVAGQTRSVLSRVAFAGADHTGRSNKFAHHLILDDAERGPAGPAWPMLHGVMAESWEGGEPHVLPSGRFVPNDPVPNGPASTWEAAAGDAGWAGVLAGHAAIDPSKIVYITCPPGSDALQLAHEAIRILPPALRWQVTFNTYFTEATAGVICAWRFVIAGTPAAVAARGTIIDLTGALGDAPGNPYVEAARTGNEPVITRPILIEADGSGVAGSRRLSSRRLADTPFEVAESDTGSSRARHAPVIFETEDDPAPRSKTWVLAIVLPVVVLVLGLVAVFALRGTGGKTSAQIGQTTTSPATQPKTQTPDEPKSELHAQPTSQSMEQPTTNPANQPAPQSAEQPTTNPATHPETQATAQPTTNPATQPATQSTEQPATNPATQPVLQESNQVAADQEAIDESTLPIGNWSMTNGAVFRVKQFSGEIREIQFWTADSSGWLGKFATEGNHTAIIFEHVEAVQFTISISEDGTSLTTDFKEQRDKVFRETKDPIKKSNSELDPKRKELAKLERDISRIAKELETLEKDNPEWKKQDESLTELKKKLNECHMKIAELNKPKQKWDAVSDLKGGILKVTVTNSDGQRMIVNLKH